MIRLTFHYQLDTPSVRYSWLTTTSSPLFSGFFLALINNAINDGDQSWQLDWLENRMRYIERAENVIYDIPGKLSHPPLFFPTCASLQVRRLQDIVSSHFFSCAYYIFYFLLGGGIRERFPGESQLFSGHDLLLSHIAASAGVREEDKGNGR